MKYAYRNKKTYKLKNKLKLLLTILLAALISTTGYILSKNAFADTSPYGTATVTYNTGTDGQFVDGTTTNTVTYNLRKVTTKYSHTPNVEDNGKIKSSLPRNLDENEVITMPGASTLTVDIYYGGTSNSNWLSVWAGSYPNYTAGSNYNSIGAVTTSMGAPNNNNQFYGYQSGNYIVNGIPISSVGHFTLTIPNNSVTFGFKSSSIGGYGYYAIVSANENEVTPTIDDIVSGEYKEPIENSATGIFDGWGTDITTITGNTSVSAVYSSPKYSGTYDGVSWGIRNGKLFIGQYNTTQTFTNRSSRSANSYPWYNYAGSVESVRFFGTVSGNGSMAYMLYNMKFLTDINFNNFNTNNVTNMNNMFGGCTSLTTLDLTLFDTSGVTSMSNMFSNCKGLTTLDLTPLDTRSVTDISYMFNGCSNLTTLDLSPLSTSNVTSMSNMFYGCSGLTSLDLTPLDTSNVTNMSAMFCGCSGLTSLDLTALNTSNVTSMASMFAHCSSLTSLDLTPLDTRSVTKMNNMFQRCTSLTSLDLSPLNTNNVTDISYMFNGCSNLTTLDLSPLNTNNVTNMDSLFNGCSGLTNLNLTSLNTSNVTNMRWMFCDCSSLTALNLNSFTTANVIDMAHMCDGCSSLTSLDLTALNTSNVTNMYGMFCDCSSLTTLDLNSFTTANVVDMGRMFSGCSGLTTLDLISLNTSSLVYMGEMFLGCSNLQEINLSNFDSSNIRLTDSYATSDCFYSLPKLNKLILGANFKMTSYMHLIDSWTKQYTFNTYSADYLMNNYDGATMAGTYIRTKQSAYFALLYENGDLVFQSGSTPESGRGNVVATYTDYLDNTYNRAVDIPWYNNRTLVKNVIFRNTIVPDSTSYWFYGMINLESFSGVEDYLDLSNVSNMVSMFENCIKLTSLDFSNLSLVSLMNDLSSMFRGCTSLRTLNISGFCPGPYTNVANMFSNTPSLRELTLGSEWGRTSGTSLSGQWIKNGDTKIWDAVALMDEYVGWYMAGTYRWPAAYAILYDTGEMVFQRGNTPDPTRGNVINTYTGFEDAIYSNYSNVPWYSQRSSINTVSFEDEIVPVATHDWFYEFGNLTSIANIEYLNTISVTDMSYMFGYCQNLVTLDVGNFNTRSVTDLSGMFSRCSSLATLDVSNFDTSNVTDMSNMFRDCSSLTSLDLSNFNTANVTNMYSMFDGCESLEVLDISSFDTNKVTNMGDMFQNCSSLTNINLSSFNTGNVGNMTQMFDNCSSLINLDVSNFDTSNVTDMRWLFGNCSSLTNLNVSSFDTNSANIMIGMFGGCSGLTSLNLSNFNTTNVTSMSYMFRGCTNLASLDLSSFSTASNPTMNYMFQNTTNLVTLKLGTNWSFSSSNNLTKSWLRDGDTTRYTAAQLTSSYDGSTMSGTYRAVQQLTITEEVRGNIANTNKNFNFTINVQNGGSNVTGFYAYYGTKSGNLMFFNGTASFTLKHGDNIYTYLPYKVTYTITQNSDGYTLSQTNNTGTLSSDRTAIFVDTLEGTTPTGVFVDLIPYIILIIFGGFGIFILRKFKYI